MERQVMESQIQAKTSFASILDGKAYTKPEWEGKKWVQVVIKGEGKQLIMFDVEKSEEFNWSPVNKDIVSDLYIRYHKNGIGKDDDTFGKQDSMKILELEQQNGQLRNQLDEALNRIKGLSIPVGPAPILADAEPRAPKASSPVPEAVENTTLFEKGPDSPAGQPKNEPSQLV
jgi:hypothetical protein